MVVKDWFEMPHLRYPYGKICESDRNPNNQIKTVSIFWYTTYKKQFFILL